jgi:FAD/FMN-containing dehydrogenase
MARLTVPIINTFSEYIAEFVNRVGIEDGGNSMVIVEFYPGKKLLSVPRDATAFYQRGNWVDYHAMVGWGQRAELDSWVAGWIQRLIDNVTKLEKADDEIPDDIKTGGQNGYFYTGDGANRKQIFGTNYERLRTLKRKYDPDMVFHSWYPITPAD